MTRPGDARPVVLHLRNSDRFGGPERLIVEAAARARATRPVVATFADAGGTSPFLAALGARGLHAVVVEQAGSYDPRTVARLRRLAHDVGAHVVVGHDYKADLMLAAAGLLPRRAGHRPRRGAVVHGYTAEDRKVAAFEAMDRRVLRRFEAVVAVSAPVREALVASGVPASRVQVVENAVDVTAVAARATEAATQREARRAAWGLASGDVVFVALGRLSPEKGPDVLLAAWRRVAAQVPRAALVFVGDGVLRDDLVRAARDLPAGRVVFAGWSEDPVADLAAADVCVLPSRREGLPLAALEAMAAGVCVCATRVGALPEVLDEGRAGRLVPPDDPEALAVALVALAGDAGGRPALAAAARLRVAARYDAPRQVERLEAVWGRLHRQGVPGR